MSRSWLILISLSPRCLKPPQPRLLGDSWCVACRLICHLSLQLPPRLRRPPSAMLRRYSAASKPSGTSCPLHPARAWMVCWGNQASWFRSPFQLVFLPRSTCSPRLCSSASPLPSLWATTNRQCSTARARRLELLRLGDVKAWANSMRPLNRFSPDWVRGADGTHRRPTAQADILQGSVQEWGRLLREPVNFWSHEAVQPLSTSSAPRRGTLNFEVLAHAAAGSPLALVGQAMLHPGPWRLVPVCAADVRYLSPASLRVADWVLSLRGGNWFAARPMPCPGPLFELLSFCGKRASEITLDHFRWPPADAVMVIREFSPPDLSAVSPTSPTAFNGHRGPIAASGCSSPPGQARWWPASPLYARGRPQVH